MPSIIDALRNEQEPAVVIPENAESIRSLDDLDHEILLATRRRGRVWRNVAPAGVDPAGVKVNIPAPVPPGLKQQDTVVYLFEEGPAQLPAADGKPQGKQYLGEFRVTDVSRPAGNAHARSAARSVRAATADGEPRRRGSSTKRCRPTVTRSSPT